MHYSLMVYLLSSLRAHSNNYFLEKLTSLSLATSALVKRFFYGQIAHFSKNPARDALGVATTAFHVLLQSWTLGLQAYTDKP